MDELASTEFRKSYPRITEVTLVTVNGHILGTWIPRANASAVLDAPRDVPELTSGLTQATRDALLRKINKS
jgi:hypothetical protein